LNLGALIILPAALKYFAGALQQLLAIHQGRANLFTGPAKKLTLIPKHEGQCCSNVLA
jgi:hypothetical protein